MLVGLVRTGCSWMRALRCGRGHASTSLLGAMAGERQEHVVEAWSGQSDVVDVESLSRSQPATRTSRQDRGGRRQLARAGVDEHFGAVLRAAPARPQVDGVSDGDDQAGGARLLLELQRRAVGDDAALVDHDDVVGELIGFLRYRVVSSSVVPCSTRPRITSQGRCGCGDPGRWSARRGTAQAATPAG